MNIYDHVAISTVESPSEDNGFTREQILINLDPIEVTSIREVEGIYIVKGISYNTGDSVDYFLGADTIVGLWAV